MVGISGITVDNAKRVKEAGADAIAVISTLFAADNRLKTSQLFNLTFKQ
jgi:thiamine monophosphate synthase